MKDEKGNEIPEIRLIESHIGEGVLLLAEGVLAGQRQSMATIGAMHNDVWDDPICKAEVKAAIEGWLMRLCKKVGIEAIKGKDNGGNGEEKGN